jgi:hypothetical protein
LAVNNKHGTGKPRAGQGESEPVGIDPGRFYAFDDFCRILSLAPVARKHLLASLQLANRTDEFVQLSREQRFVWGQAGIAHLSAVCPDVREELKAKSRSENRRRRDKNRGHGA